MRASNRNPNYNIHNGSEIHQQLAVVLPGVPILPVEDRFVMVDDANWSFDVTNLFINTT